MAGALACATTSSSSTSTVVFTYLPRHRPRLNAIHSIGVLNAEYSVLCRSNAKGKRLMSTAKPPSHCHAACSYCRPASPPLPDSPAWAPLIARRALTGVQLAFAVQNTRRGSDAHCANGRPLPVMLAALFSSARSGVEGQARSGQVTCS